jgi:anaphase-promoting complex subunit 11
MKIKIHALNLVATWSWSLPPDYDELCGICRVQFDGTCPACKFPGDDCPLLIGKCQHSFHMHCLLMWVQQESSRGLCPMCRQPFTWRREENGAAARGGMVGSGVVEEVVGGGEDTGTAPGQEAGEAERDGDAGGGGEPAAQAAREGTPRNTRTRQQQPRNAV